MKKISVFLIILGILTALYPLADRLYGWYWHQRLLAAWEEELVESYLGLAETLADEGEDTEEDLAPDVLGLLTIPKIDLRLPILPGTGATTLKRGAGLLEGSPGLGELGNTAISAHRSHTYGRNFNRLDEVEVGDSFAIATIGATYTYEVYRRVIVEPTDLSVLAGDDAQDTVTLITCHPLYTATHRLIVQGRAVVAEGEKSENGPNREQGTAG